MKKKYDVVLVGASSAGLALMFLLARQGLRVAVLDSRKGIAPILRPEIIQPRLLEIISDMGLLSDILAHPHQKCSVFNFYATAGPRLCQVDYGLLNHPFPYTLITLPHVLQAVLHARLELAHPADLYWRTPVLDVLRADSRIVGCVADVQGQQVEFEAPVVIGADGANSKIRQLLGISYQRHIYENGFLSFPLSHLNRPSEVDYFLGRQKILGVFPVSPDGGCALYLASSSLLKSRGDLSSFKESVAEIYPASSLEAIRSWDQVMAFPCSRIKARRWVVDGACIMGDAAHATHPHVAQGTTQAVEDALVLADLLKDCFAVGDFSSRCLGAYEEARRPCVTRLQRLADEYVWLWDTGNPLLASLRDRAFRNVGKSERLLYKTIASEAGLHAEGLTLWDRLRAVIGL